MAKTITPPGTRITHLKYFPVGDQQTGDLSAKKPHKPPFSGH
jgi:hypothetical protein